MEQNGCGALIDVQVRHLSLGPEDSKVTQVGLVRQEHASPHIRNG